MGIKKIFKISIAVALLSSFYHTAVAQEATAQNTVQMPNNENAASSKPRWATDVGVIQVFPQTRDANNATKGLLDLRYSPNQITYLLAAEFTHVWTSYEEPGTNDFEDTELVAIQSFPANFESIKFSHSIKLILPTSRTSRLSSMNAGASYQPGIQKKWGRFSLPLRVEFIGYSFKYETSDVEGNAYNPIWAVYPKILPEYQLSDKLRVDAKLLFYTSRNYNNNTTTDYIFWPAVYYEVMQNAELSFEYVMKDRVITNNSLFDDDISTFRLGLNVSLL